MLNKNELILDKVRSLAVHDLGTGELLFRLTSIEDPSLQCTAEGEEVTDALGALITTLYRAKKASFSATNSLIALDLAAAQYGAKKEIAGLNKSTLTDSTYEILEVDGGAVRLSHKPSNDIRYIYSIINREIGTSYTAAATAATATEFFYDEAENKIIVPTDFTGKVYVEYQYETENAMRIINRASQFPSAVKLSVYAYFKDKCNENIVYSGKILCPKAKLNPEQIELALTSTGKHPFEFTMMRDYCQDEGEDELFSIIISE